MDNKMDNSRVFRVVRADKVSYAKKWEGDRYVIDYERMLPPPVEEYPSENHYFSTRNIIPE